MAKAEKLADRLMDDSSLSSLVQDSHFTSVQRGWWSAYGAGAPHETHDPTFIEACMLVATEVAEAVEAFRSGADVARMTYTYTWEKDCPIEVRSSNDTGLQYRVPGTYSPVHAEFGWEPLTPEVVRGYGGIVKPGGVPSELADILIRVFDIAGAWGVDLEEAVRVKMEFNKTRPPRHGGKRL